MPCWWYFSKAKSAGTILLILYKTRIYLPRVPPVAMAKDIWDRSSGEGLRAPRVAAMPPATPIIPRVFPKRLVRWAERPASAPTQHMPEPKYIIWCKKQTKTSLELLNMIQLYLSLYILSPAQCCIQLPLKLHIPQQMQPQAAHTGSCTQEGQWDAWTCPASSGWSENHLHIRTEKQIIFTRLSRQSSPIFILCWMSEPAMLMEETKAAARARLSGIDEGVRPPPISTRPPTAVRPDRKNRKNNHEHTPNRFLNMDISTLSWFLTWDGIGYRHKRGMKSGGHTPHSVVSHNPSQAEGRDHLSECCVWGDDTQSQTGGQTYRDRAKQWC